MMKIPKIIYYCWFGKKQLPELAKKCIDSWKKFLPNYEIKEWNEQNFNIDACLYTKQAYSLRKYAFVSDYARFKILYDNGGIYFDTDVELIKSIDDIIENGPFMAFEKNNLGININPGLGIASYSKHKIYKEILDIYENMKFIKDDNTLNLTIVGQYTTEIFKKYGLQNETKLQKIEDIYIYPKDYFSPKEFETQETIITKNTRAIHHYSASWIESYSRREYIVICKYKLVRFKRNKKIIDDEISINKNEKILFIMKVSQIKKIAILKEV